MGLLDRHLIVLIVLVALAGAAVALPRGIDGADAGSAALDELPLMVNGWTASASAPEDVLPHDPRARDSASWTYSQGNREIFVSIARYRPRRDSDWRPSINQIAPARGAASLKHDLLTMGLNGSPTQTTPLSVVSIRGPQRNLSIVYWYQVKEKTIAEELPLRLALLVNALRFRSPQVWLVRIATSADDQPQDFLRGFYPQLVKTLSR